MLSFKFITDSGGAAHYFKNTDDYYAKDGHAGSWEGEGAKLLGLQGGIDSAMFKQLLEGRLPSGEQVRKPVPKTQGNGKKSKERLGIDFTFSAPKSVSIAALVNGDMKLIEAHESAVREALKHLEARAVARKKEKGISFRQHTNNLTFATFRHDLSRSQDPQLHTHAVAMNLTQRDDGRWVALTNDEMLKSIKVVGAVYRSELAQRLTEMGYEIRSTRNGFELAAVSDKAIDLFSKRSKQIEEALDSKGLDRDTAGSKTKQTVTQATRPNKTDADRAVLREDWVEVLKEAGIKLEKGSRYEEIATKVKEVAEEIGRAVLPQSILDRLDAARDEKEAEVVKRAVDFAVEHLMERQGIFTKSEIIERALLRGLGKFVAIEAEIANAVRAGRIIAELPLYQSAKSFSRDKQAEAKNSQYDKFKHNDDDQKLTAATWVAMTMSTSGKTQAQAEKLVHESIQNGRLVKVEERFTTRVMLSSEQHILRMEEVGRGTVVPITTVANVHAMFANSKLNEGQKSAAQLILTSPNRFIGVQGYAGVGKSHMLKDTLDAIKLEAVKAAKDQGFDVIGIAPYASQNKALADLGMQSQTLASFLLRKQDSARLGPNTTVFLDEASVVPVHQMQDLMQKVEAAGARLVLIGDRKQTQAVEAGKPFEQLQDAGMSLAHITEIRRQINPELKAAVVNAADDKIAESVAMLANRTYEIKAPERRHQGIAMQYAALSEDERNNTIIVSGTNDARRGINAAVRAELKLQGGTQVKTLDSVDMTRAEKKQAGNFKPGQVLTLEGDKAEGMARGKPYDIIQVIDQTNQIVIRDADGVLLTVDPSKLGSVSAYTKEEVTLTKGDWVRVTRNNMPLGIANGERYKIQSVSADFVMLSNGSKLPRAERLHLQYGYAATIHSAQGLTTDRVIIDADTKSLTSNRAVYYVAISRPRSNLAIYTDDKTKLAEVMAREPKKYAAMELRNSGLEKAMAKEALQRQALMKNAKVASKQQIVTRGVKQR